MKELKEVDTGYTKRYEFAEARFVEEFNGNDVELVDGHGNRMELGIPPEQFIGIIQTLINRNQYLYMKKLHSKVTAG